MKAAELKERVDIEDVLLSMGWDGQTYGYGDRKKTRCPLHSDRTASASIDLTNGRLNCFAGCTDGPADIIDLVMLEEGLDFVEACQFIEEKFLD